MLVMLALAKLPNKLENGAQFVEWEHYLQRNRLFALLQMRIKGHNI